MSIPNDIDLYFNEGNLGIGITKPDHKLHVQGDIKTNNLKLKNTTINSNDELKITNDDGSNFILKKDKSSILSDKIGINNIDPQYTFDIAGNFRVAENIYGNNGNIIISHNEDINIDPESKYNNINLNNNVNIKNDLILDNNITDKQNNKLIDFNDNLTFNFNKNEETNKSISFYGQVDFKDVNKGVNIGTDTTIGAGELNVANKIKTKKIQISDEPDKMINLEGDQAGNIKMGKYTYLSNLSTNNESNQTSLFGNNLYSDNDNVRIAETTENHGYRGITMNDINGIQFYTSTGQTARGNIPNLPSITISNEGQLIHTVPVLSFNFEIDDLDNDVYRYIRKQLGNKTIGSMMTFTTNSYLANDQLFNVIKNTATTAKCYIIDKKTNNVSQYFDISLQ